MPEMDGFRVAECIRATEKTWSDSVAQKSSQGKLKANKVCPIIAVTGFADINVLQARANQVGIDKII